MKEPEWDAVARRVPWNAAWSGEEAYDVRPCRWADGQLALWSPHRPGEGRPLFARPHAVRQRRSITERRCTVCGQRTPEHDRWWFRLGQLRDGLFMTTEAPVHRRCAEFALTICPHLRGREPDLQRFPRPARVLASIVGGAATERDFGVHIAGRRVVGALKFAWRPKTLGMEGVAT